MLRYLIAFIAATTAANAAAEEGLYTDYAQFLKEVRSTEARGMIVLTAPGCEPCVKYKRELLRNTKQLRDRGVVVCVLDTSDPKNRAVVEYVQKQYPKWRGQVPATVMTDKDAKTGIGLKIGFMLVRNIFAWLKWLL